MKKNYFDKDHPHIQEVEYLLRETFCIGVLETDGEKLVKGMLMFSIVQILLFPFIVLSKVSKILILVFVWMMMSNISLESRNIETIVVTLTFIFLFSDEIETTLSDVLKAVAIQISGGLILKWLAKGFIEGKSFRQGIVEDAANANLTTALSGVMESKYRTKYDHLHRLYMRSKSIEGENELIKYMEKLKVENQERMPYLN